jgi:hypothetical protein
MQWDYDCHNGIIMVGRDNGDLFIHYIKLGLSFLKPGHRIRHTEGRLE